MGSKKNKYTSNNSTRYKGFFLVVISIIFLSGYFAAIRGVLVLPDRITFLGVTVYSYSVFIMLGVALSAYLFSKESKKYEDLKEVDVVSALIYIVIPAIIGARLWHVMTDWHLYIDEINKIILVRNGGLGIFGAFLGGVLGAFVYSKRHKFDIVKAMDLLAVFLPLGHAVGRIGNFVNYELLGVKSSNFLAVYVPVEGVFRHATFLYEQIGNILLFTVLYYLYRKFGLEKLRGMYIAIYVVGYGLIRFTVDFYRLEPEFLFGLTVAQTVSLVMILTGSVFLVKCYQGIKSKKHDK